MTTIELGGAADRMSALLAAITDEQLAGPTPCAEYRLGDLVEHIGGLALAFTQAARKELGPDTGPPPAGDAARLPADWRTAYPAQLGELAEAWRDPAALAGMTRVGGVDLPGEVAGMVAMNELVVHGWDVARSIGADYSVRAAELAAALEFVEQFSGPESEADREGLFGPVVTVDPGQPPLDRLIGLSGRDPRWTPSAG
ncbi:TIGR03086 family metal-binding protein [Crossiella sp. CA-258035]|uniref:TIGR03086 family metal-binding protein n=1 Tax=Crossiella sp. CA-258035 TaxID=2981138 RepID=UPI0024BCA3B8|nr:TIGR03086 family metal-binding protein [Crossiella sp. CA-258035]WHT17464.1 TIGR03086 family metal-binding protein [Crossiella sp. CA-258035]